MRANGLRATIARAGLVEQVQLEEADPSEAAGVLEVYTALIPHVKPYLDVPEQPGQNDWMRLSATHPVFRVLPLAQLVDLQVDSN